MQQCFENRIVYLISILIIHVRVREKPKKNIERRMLCNSQTSSVGKIFDVTKNKQQKHHTAPLKIKI